MRWCLLLLIACASRAASPTPKKLDAAIEPLAYFVGRWSATLENPATNERWTLQYVVAPALGGRWLIGGGRVPEIDLEIHDLWGIDPQGGDIVRTLFDSQGTLGTVRSKGWNGNTLVFEGAASATGARLEIRETITRVGADHFKAVWESKTETGWSAYSVEDLRRQP